MSVILKGIGCLFMGASLLAIACILTADLLGAFVLLGIGMALFLVGLWIYDKGENIGSKVEKKKRKRTKTARKT